MKTNLMVLSVVFNAVFALSALASGFVCESNDGYEVKLYNHTDPSKGTKNPAAFLLSSGELGTLVERFDTEIAKTSLSNSTLYSVEGNSKTKSDRIRFAVAFKEGVSEEREGDTVVGNLTFFGGEGEVNHGLTCTRYLKGKLEAF